MNNAMFEDAVESFLSAAECSTARIAGANSFLAHYNAGVVRECLGYRDEALSLYLKCGAYPPAQQRLAVLAKA